MSRNTNNIPFTEIVERVQDLSRTATDDKKRIRGIVNDVYCQEIPRAIGDYIIKSQSAISCLSEINSGVASITTQNTAVYLSGIGITLESSHTGRKIKFSNNDNVYDFTFAKANSGTISPPLSGVTSVSNGAYTIFKDIYSLASDFDRFPINGGLLFYSAGQPTPLPELEDSKYYNETDSTPSSVPTNCRFYNYDSAGNIQVQIVPPPSTSYVLPYEYVKILPPMIENSGGTILMTSNSTAVTGTGTVFLKSNTGDYVRVSAFGTGEDSEWYRIEAIATNSAMTLSKAFRIDTNATTTDFVISSAPELPSRIQDGIIYGSLRNLIIDQNDPNYIFYHMRFCQILSDNKVLIKSRNTQDKIELIAEDPDYRR